MINAFLNFARPQPLQLEEVFLNELIDECGSELKPFYDTQKVDLIIEPRRSRPPGFTSDAANQRLTIRADERMLRQVLLNLLRNAAEAIPEEKSVRRVRVSCYEERDANAREWAVVEIEDSGEGIPITDLQRIFIPFFTTKAQGHGIGLALAHRVIAEHGGSLTAANAGGGGAIFTIRLMKVP